jgi:hypothetical protein
MVERSSFSLDYIQNRQGSTAARDRRLIPTKDCVISSRYNDQARYAGSACPAFSLRRRTAGRRIIVQSVIVQADVAVPLRPIISGSDYRMKGTVLTYAAVTLIVGIALLGVLSLRF